MAKGEPLLKDLFIQDEYTVVKPELTMPQAAAIFSEKPGDVLLIYDRESDEFLGCMYLHDFHRAYAGTGKSSKQIHKAVVSDVMITAIETIEWTANVSQGWALVTTRHPHGIILRDEGGRFAGYLSNDDLSSAKGELDEASELTRGERRG